MYNVNGLLILPILFLWEWQIKFSYLIIWKRLILSGCNLTIVIIAYKMSSTCLFIANLYFSENFLPKSWFASQALAQPFQTWSPLYSLLPRYIAHSGQWHHVVRRYARQALGNQAWWSSLREIWSPISYIYILFAVFPSLFLISSLRWLILHVNLTGPRGAQTFGQLLWVCLWELFWKR